MPSGVGGHSGTSVTDDGDGVPVPQLEKLLEAQLGCMTALATLMEQLGPVPLDTVVLRTQLDEQKVGLWQSTAWSPCTWVQHQYNCCVSCSCCWLRSCTAARWWSGCCASPTHCCAASPIRCGSACR